MNPNVMNPQMIKMKNNKITTMGQTRKIKTLVRMIFHITHETKFNFPPEKGIKGTFETPLKKESISITTT